MLIGRDAEVAQIDDLLARAKSGRGGAVVVRGEAGVGKTALLERVVDAASGFRVLRALGVEGEAELPFAGLHELVRPVVHLVEELPSRQSRAIRAALALDRGDAADRFSVCAATLGLLTAAAGDGALLCVVDDAQWLDQASAEALLFAARRIDRDALALVFAVRDRADAFPAPGIGELRLRRLTASEARRLLAERAAPLVAAVADRIVDAACGNPLALLEFAQVASWNDSVGGHLLVSEAVERTFLARASRLSPAAQRTLQISAASDPDDPASLWAALELERIGAEPLVEAEQAGLLVRGSRIDFSHPLARSALYQSAAPAERRSAHRALAETTRAPDRRAWHRAAAAAGPDEDVAAALEQAAAAARRRGGVAAEAAALERAAALTPNEQSRARRLLNAGIAADAAGLFEPAERLLAEAAQLTTDANVRADAVARLSYLLYDRGEFERALESARAEVESAPQPIFARVLGEVLVHRLEVPAALATAERAAEFGGDSVRDDLELRQMLAWTLELSGRSEDGVRIDLESLERVEPGTLAAIEIATHFLYLEDYPRARSLLARILAHEREVGASGNLAYALDQTSRLETRAGSLTSAYALSLECLQLTEPLGTNVGLAAALAWLALVEAMLGRREAREHGARALEIAQRIGDRWNEVRARSALGLEAIARRDFEAAAACLQPAVDTLAAGELHHPNVFRVHGDLIEAHVRLDNQREAEEQFTRLSMDAELSESKWAAAICARSRGLLADVHADAEFAAALALHAHDPSDWERARTELLYGEHLRRARHRRLARVHLRAALATFERVGSTPWAERARAELRATGEHVRRSQPTAHEQLTPQELQVSLAAADGLTNKQIATRLFISPKTVEFHLSNAYRKLELDQPSRRELIKLFAKHGADAAVPDLAAATPRASTRRARGLAAGRRKGAS